MTATFQTGADRAFRRGAGVVLFRPPGHLLTVCQRHIIETHLGRRRLLWRPGVEVWNGEDTERWTSEFAREHHWKYVAIALLVAPGGVGATHVCHCCRLGNSNRNDVRGLEGATCCVFRRANLTP
jgi:hypothetical protein